MSKIAVVLMAYGSPDRLDDVAAYYADIRGGRPIRPELLDDARRALPPPRHRGREPAERDHRGDARRARDRARLPVFTGMKHWTPRIADGRRAGGRDRAPTRSSASCSRRTTRAGRSPATGEQLEDALAGRAELAFVESWHDEPGLRRAPRRSHPRNGRARRLHRPLAARADPRRRRPVRGAAPRDVAARGRGGRRRRLVVLVPVRVADRRAVARARHPRPPRRRSTPRASSRVLVCPVGFVSDHLEIRWDIDVEAAERAAELGLRARADRDAERRAGVRRRSRGDRPPGRRATVCDVDDAARRDPDRERRPPLPRLPAARADAEGGARRPEANARGTVVEALSDVSFSVEPGEAVGLIGRNGSGKTTLLRLIAGIMKPTDGAGRGRRPCRLAARARRRLPSGVHGPRERLPERRHPRPEARGDRPAHGGDRRLRRARALHRRARADVLVGDVHAARLRGRRAPRRRRAPARRGVRGRRRGVPAQVLRQDLRVQAARRDDRVRLARRGRGRAALLRAPCSCATGELDVRRADARGGDAVPPAARGRARSRRARRRAQRVRQRRVPHHGRRRPAGPEDEERMQFSPGEPLVGRACGSRPMRRSTPPRLVVGASRRGGACARRRARGHGGDRLAFGRAGAALSLRHPKPAARATAAFASASSSRTHAASGSTTGSTTPRASSSTRRTAARASSGSTVAGPPMSPPVLQQASDELPHLPRLAPADGDRAGPPVQALLGERGAAPGGRARLARSGTRSTRWRSAATSSGTSTTPGTRTPRSSRR